MKIWAIVGVATIAVDVEASDTIDIVKAKIQEHCGTEFDSLILLCVPVPLQLEGGRTLSDYNIQPMAFFGRTNSRQRRDVDWQDDYAGRHGDRDDRFRQGEDSGKGTYPHPPATPRLWRQ